MKVSSSGNLSGIHDKKEYVVKVKSVKVMREKSEKREDTSIPDFHPVLLTSHSSLHTPYSLLLTFFRL